MKLQIKLEPEDLEKYTSSFVTQELKNQEADIIYKLKDKNIFFLIEHQTKIDYSMAYRILIYEVEIIKSAINDKEKVKNKGKIPAVIPIVLYTGRKKWNSKLFLQQEELKGYDGIPIGRYNIVDVNNFENEELLKEKSFLSKAMLIEKRRPTEDLGMCLKQIVEEIGKDTNTYNEEQKELLTLMIDILLRRKLNDELANELIETLNQKEEKNMLAALETIDEENRMLVAKGKRAGRKEAKLEYARKMLEERISIDVIKRITGLTEREIQKLNK